MKKLFFALLIALTLTVAAQAAPPFPPPTPGATRVVAPMDIEQNSQIAIVTSTSGAEQAIPAGVYGVWAGTADAFIKVAPTTGTASDVTAATGFVIRFGTQPIVLVVRTGRKIGYISTGAGTLSLHKIN